MKEFVKKLTSNSWFLKILSLVIAILCWIYIVFITNPEIEIKISDIPITLSNHQAIKSEGYIVSNEINTTVNVRVKGTRKMLTNLDRDSIIAYVDLTECTSEKGYDLPVSIKLPYDGIELVNSDVVKVSVDVDKYISNEVPVEFIKTGNLESGNYEVIEEDIPKITVSGPEDIVNTIENAQASVDIDVDNKLYGMKLVEDIKLINSNSVEVASKIIEIKDKNIFDDCVVYQIKEVPVKPKLSSVNNEYECVVNGGVRIQGPPAVVGHIDRIETEVINVAYGEGSKKYDAKLDIPKNVFLKDSEATVEVIVKKK